MAIAGYPATVKIGANTIQDIMNLELPFKMDTVETTAFGGSGGAAVGTKTFIPTLYGMQLKLAGSWNKADTTGQALLETAFFARTLTTLIVSPNGTNTYTFGAWVSDYTIKADTKGKVDVDYSIMMNGDVTRA
jgi:hypothetical protein